MESEKQSWRRAAFLSAFSFSDKRGSFFSNGLKSLLPRAQAATAAPTTAPGGALAAQGATSSGEPALDPNDPIMAVRRNLVGKAFSLYVQQSPRIPKYDDLTAEVTEIFSKHIQDGFTLEVQRQMGHRFMTNHRISMGQRSQNEPPANYALMSHLVLGNGAVLVGSYALQGNMMARFIKEAHGILLSGMYNSQTDAKGQESTAVELEISKSDRDSSVGVKYAHQQTPQGGGGGIELTFVRRILPDLMIGLHGMLLPQQGRFMNSFSVRYEKYSGTAQEEADWERNLAKARAKVETLTEEDPLTAYDSCVLAAAFFKPKWIVSANVSPLQQSLELGYVNKLSSSITIGTQFSIHPAPPGPQGGPPSLKASWGVGYEYNAEPNTSVKVALTNLSNVSCVYEDSLTEFLGVSVSAVADWPKDTYKTGFGVSLRL